jgi:flavin-dependent dehydrogenase
MSLQLRASAMIYDAIVIGAGPAGSSTAIMLARQGRAVAIVERTEFPRRKVCGEFISATNLALLDRLGAGEAWRAEAGPEIRRVGFFGGDVSAEARMPSKGGFGRALGRDLLDRLLLDRARSAGAEILQPWRVIGIEREGELQAVTIEAKGEEKILRAPVIVAAHGSWEPGKLPSQLDKINNPSDLLGFKAHFKGSSLAPDLMPLLIFPGGYGGMVWSDHGRLSLSCCIRRDMLTRIRAEQGSAAAAEALHRHILDSCSGVREAIGHASLDGPWLAAGPIRPGIRPRYAEDIFRVGNIAGESHPIIAEGISMAMQSGWLLGEQLGRVDASRPADRALAAERYSAAWRRLFAMRIHAAAAFAQIAVQPASARVMMTVIRLFPKVLTLGAALSGKTRAVPGLA